MDNDRIPFPQETSIEFGPLDGLKDPTLSRAAAYWLELRGARRFPSREELQPSRIPWALRSMALVRVIDGGADFEYRIVGDSVARAFGVPLHNRRLSAVTEEAPSLAAKIGLVYGHGVRAAEGFALRGTVGREAQWTTFTSLEAAVLPLGADGATVDHLLTFMVCDRRVG